MTGIKEFEFEVARPLAVELPMGAEVLGVGMRGGKPRMWVMAEIGPRPTEVRKFVALATGSMFDEGKVVGELRCVGSVLVAGAKAVEWHVFEVVQRIIRVN